MMKNDDIIFDSKAGISVEEQKEILSKINGIAEKNRRALSESLETKPGDKHGGKQIIKAKKNSAVFPLIVNIAAVVILAGGGFFLVSFNGKKDAQIKTGNAVYNYMEKALIEEIRRDTTAKIAAKESEITMISARLHEVDTELLQLFSSHQELTAEQLAAQEGLLALQNTYRVDLSNLKEERSQILEDSRSREAKLRVQLEERTKEFTAVQERTSGELDSARSELGRLTGEQERIASIDAQLSGSLPAVSALIQSGNYDQAALAVNNMRHLFNDSAFSNARAFQSKREFYSNAINFMELVINEGEKNSISFAITSQNLQSQNIQLEGTISEMQGAIESISANSENQIRRITELEQTVSSLRNTNSGLQVNVSSLRTANAAFERSITELNSTIAGLRSANTTQQTTIGELNDTITDLRGRNTAQQTTIGDLNSTISGLRTTNATQQTTIGDLNSTITGLRTANTAQQTTIGELNQTISGLQSTNSAQQTEITGLYQTNSRLQASNNSQAQEITNLRHQIDELRELQ